MLRMNSSNRRKYVAEIFGTFALVFAGTGAIVINDLSGGAITHPGIALTFGLIVLAMIYTTGDISGAHLNPAVTIAFWVSGRFQGRLVIPYLLSQLTGALAASLMLRLLFPNHGTLGGTFPAGSSLQSFGLELILTGILMTVIFGVSSGAKEKGLLAGVAIGAVIALEAMFAGPISGASMNPVRSLAPALVAGEFSTIWIYLTAPFAGALLAIPLFALMDLRDSFFPQLRAFLTDRAAEFGMIPTARKEELQQLSRYIREQLAGDRATCLTFICTHNSRRSHLAQIWAKVAADYYGLTKVETFSGGTEATAFNPRAIAALRSSGLQIATNNEQSSNPVYLVSSSDSSPPLVCFSKIYDQAPNPTAGYCAVMTCSQADDACPVVIGCALRLPLRYEDPKIADGTAEESQRYSERSQQICREMLYAMSQVNHP